VSGGVDVIPLMDQNDSSIALGFLLAVVGFLIGLGFFNYPVKRLLGAVPSLAEHETGGGWRYFRLCTDHKVVGIQYLVGTLFFFFIAGLNAMFMRTELLFPTERFWPPDQYLTLVGFNMLATLVTMRAPGMTWTRLPIFVWGVSATAILMLLAAPVLVVTMVMVLMDRSVFTGFFVASAGGSTYLYQNLFWFFGHPEVYIL